jgi:peptidyl-prolyl cis-trans isomerase B (cyclophilin B)
VSGFSLFPVVSFPAFHKKTYVFIKEINVVRIETSKGTIVVELFEDKAPKTVKNFLRYVKEGLYEGTIFHRVIKNFMIQGGGMDEKMQERKTFSPVKNEADNGLKNEAYTLAMARTMEPHSATAQFFINTVDNGFLNHTAKTEQGWGYAVFGKVVEGKDVVDAIKNVETGAWGFYEDVPKETVTITKVELAE